MKPPEKVKRELVRQWLDKAEKDFGLAKHLVLENKPYFEASCFHAQQAAEKYLKALLVWHQVEFPKTHDLDEILDLVATIDSPLAESLRDVITLTPYGVEIRYPGDFPDTTPEDAKTAVELAGKVRDAVVSTLKDYLGMGEP